MAYKSISKSNLNIILKIYSIGLDGHECIMNKVISVNMETSVLQSHEDKYFLNPEGTKNYSHKFMISSENNFKFWIH